MIAIFAAVENAVAVGVGVVSEIGEVAGVVCAVAVGVFDRVRVRNRRRWSSASDLADCSSPVARAGWQAWNFGKRRCILAIAVFDSARRADEPAMPEAGRH